MLTWMAWCFRTVDLKFAVCQSHLEFRDGDVELSQTGLRASLLVFLEWLFPWFPRRLIFREF